MSMIHPPNIPVFILAGGLGTRISEETALKPKPMVEVGGLPILVHLMRSYYSYGFNDFVICAGYKSWEIKKFFLTYEFRQNHLEIDHRVNIQSTARSFLESNHQERWRVRVIDTGELTMTGGRFAKAFNEIYQHSPFEHCALTYGDGLSDVNLTEELKFHLSHNRIGTVLGVKPTPRFGELAVDGHNVTGFLEKPKSKHSYINGGFFFFKKEIKKYMALDENSTFEKEPLENLAKDNQLSFFKHDTFWQPMDTLRDKMYLEGLWNKNEAPWKHKAPSNDTRDLFA